jgi:hypothetical protein
MNPASARVGTKDITSILAGWSFEPGTINVRKITGANGTPKLQMRLDLGLLQMELSGRPDGQRPHGFESLLEYFQHQLAKYTTNNGTDLGFVLTRTHCQLLRDEATMYYHRYLSLFVLDDYAGVMVDTERNLKVLDLCKRYAGHQLDRLAMEQYRPYITMMNARARAKLLLKKGLPEEAERVVVVALRLIKGYFREARQLAFFARSNEAFVLRTMLKEIRRSLPQDPVRKLKGRLAKAIQREKYEEAAKLRDAIAALEKNNV